MRLTARLGAISVCLVGLAALAGCSSASQRRLAACGEDYGGSQAACDDLSRQEASDRRFQNRLRQREAAEASGRQARSRWSIEVQQERRVDRGALIARYPKAAWATGIWCDQVNLEHRFQITGASDFRIVTHTPPRAAVDGKDALRDERYVYRLRDDAVELWGPLGKVSVIRELRLTRGAGDVMSVQYVRLESADRQTPFSGSPGSGGYTASYKRCLN